jgi:hypothetical protein
MLNNLSPNSKNNINPKETHSSEQGEPLVYCCPATGEQLAASDQMRIQFMGERAIWWQCPACRGWHIFLVKVEHTPRGSCLTP